MKFKRHLKIERGNIDLTPLVNVFFLLLIFFLFTSSFIFQPGISVNLPKAVTSEVVGQDNAVIIITRDDTIYLDDRAVLRDELASKLEKIGKDKMGLLVKADSKSSHGCIVDIWDMCRQYGISQVSVATN